MNQALRIAVADDEPLMQMYFEETLSLLGYHVVFTAGDGRQFLDRWREQPADLIITDIKMPGLDGLNAVREIYRDGIVPVIFVTGYNSLQDVAREDEVPFVHVYLVKPVGATELRKAVEAALLRLEEFRVLEREAGDSRRALQDLPMVERARKMLITGRDSGETGAFERLRALAADNHETIAEAARRLATQDPPE